GTDASERVMHALHSLVPVEHRDTMFTVAIVLAVLLGLAIGRLIIGPVNRFLGVIFGAFNRAFDYFTHLYGKTVGRLLRLSFMVLLIYGGLLGLTYWNMSHAPTGFIPTQDQGYLLVNVQLPDAASVQRTQEIMNTVTRIALGD